MMSLPGDLIIDIMARVTCTHKLLSTVSRFLEFPINCRIPWTIHEISLLGCTEQCLYAILFNFETEDDRLYILHRKVNRNCLVLLIPSLPPMEQFGFYIAMGPEIYEVTDLCIDCRYHTMPTSLGSWGMIRSLTRNNCESMCLIKNTSEKQITLVFV